MMNKFKLKFLPLIISVASYSSLGLFATSAQSIDVEDPVGFSFPRTSADDSAVIAVPIPKLQGHAPGIKTFAKITSLSGGDTDPRKGNTSVDLTMCDEVTIQYQILDVDGDWDLTTDGIDRTKLSTRNTIEWFFKHNGEEWSISNDELYKIHVLKLHDELTVTNDDGEYRRFRDWMDEIHAAGETVELGYRIYPVTQYGDPYFPQEDKGSSIEPYKLKVDDFSKLFTLPAATEPGFVSVSDQNIARTDIVDAGIEGLSPGELFILSSRVIYNPNECAKPEYGGSKKFKIRYFLAEGNNAGKEVSWLATGRKYEVKFFYDDTPNSIGDEIEITSDLISDQAKDINGKPFINGLRLQLHVPNSVIGQNPLEPGAGLIGVKKVESNTEEGDVDDLHSVEKPGVPLDEFEVVTSSDTQFFYREGQKLFFYADEKSESTQAFSQVINELANNPTSKLLEEYFEDEDWLLYLNSFQGFYFNVTSQIPAYPQVANALSIEQTKQGEE